MYIFIFQVRLWFIKTANYCSLISTLGQNKITKMYASWVRTLYAKTIPWALGALSRIIISCSHTGMKDDQSAKTPDQANKHRILNLGQIQIRNLYLVSELYMLQLFLASASCATDLWRNGLNTPNWPWLISFLRPNILFSKNVWPLIRKLLVWTS